jgi:hypothetical protein
MHNNGYYHRMDPFPVIPPLLQVKIQISKGRSVQFTTS